jgi:hypothetical protein
MACLSGCLASGKSQKSRKWTMPAKILSHCKNVFFWISQNFPRPLSGNVKHTFIQLRISFWRCKLNGSLKINGSLAFLFFFHFRKQVACCNALASYLCLTIFLPRPRGWLFQENGVFVYLKWAWRAGKLFFFIVLTLFWKWKVTHPPPLGVGKQRYDWQAVLASSSPTPRVRSRVDVMAVASNFFSWRLHIFW